MTQETSHATNARILAETHFEISEFLKLFSPLLKRHLIGEGRQRSFSHLALCEIMTILVAHQIIGAPNLKHFYQKSIRLLHLRVESALQSKNFKYKSNSFQDENVNWKIFSYSELTRIERILGNHYLIPYRVVDLNTDQISRNVRGN